MGFDDIFFVLLPIEIKSGKKIPTTNYIIRNDHGADTLIFYEIFWVCVLQLEGTGHKKNFFQYFIFYLWSVL